MTKAEQTTIDDRPYAQWKRSLPGPARWRIRSALPRSARTFAPQIVAAAEESVYAKEREAVLRYKGLQPELPKDAAYGLESGRVRSDYEHTSGNTQAQDMARVPLCDVCSAQPVFSDGSWHCACSTFRGAL